MKELAFYAVKTYSDPSYIFSWVKTAQPPDLRLWS